MFFLKEKVELENGNIAVKVTVPYKAECRIPKAELDRTIVDLPKFEAQKMAQRIINAMFEGVEEELLAIIKDSL